MTFDSALSHEMRLYDLEHRGAARLEHAPALLHQRAIPAGVLHDTVGIHEVERLVGERQMLAVGLAQIRGQPLLPEVLSRERDRGRREIDTRHVGAAFGKPYQVRPGAAADFEDALSTVAVEVDQLRQVVQLFEVVLIEIGEETRRAHRMTGDLEIVNVLVPIVANGGVVGGHL